MQSLSSSDFFILPFFSNLFKQLSSHRPPSVFSLGLVSLRSITHIFSVHFSQISLISFPRVLSRHAAVINLLSTYLCLCPTCASLSLSLMLPFSILVCTWVTLYTVADRKSKGAYIMQPLCSNDAVLSRVVVMPKASQP